MGPTVPGDAQPDDAPTVAPPLSEARRAELLALGALHARRDAIADWLVARGIEPTSEAIDAECEAEDRIADERRRANEWFSALAHACIDQPTIVNHPLRERALKLFREHTRSTPLNAARAASLLHMMLVRTERVPGTRKRGASAPMPRRPSTTSNIAGQLRLWFAAIVRPEDIDAAWQGKAIKVGPGRPRADQIAVGDAIFRVLRLANLTAERSADSFQRSIARAMRKKKGGKNRL